ncbi:MAG: spore coat protein [Firmicutes bacterium]|nr:spore coat protein [Bacillota bacterium]
MNDQLLMSNYLLVLKSTVEVYVHGTLESSNKDIKELLKNGLDETMNHQERTYNEMVKNNWYTVNNIKTSDISKVLNNLQK